MGGGACPRGVCATSVFRWLINVTIGPQPQSQPQLKSGIVYALAHCMHILGKRLNRRLLPETWPRLLCARRVANCSNSEMPIAKAAN